MEKCMRTLLLMAAAFLVFGTGATLSAQDADTVDLTGYFVFGQNETVGWFYGIGDRSFVDFFGSVPVEVQGKVYVPRIRRYSTGGIDTTFYRQGEKGVYHLNAADLNKKETLTMPFRSVVGERWFESDSSWSYTINTVSGTIDTLRNLLVIRAMQLKGDAKQIGTMYDLYYAKGIGMIATMVEGKILVYLKEVRAPNIEVSEAKE